MAKQPSVTITSNGDHLLGYALPARDQGVFKGTIRVYGTWGGGSVTIKTSDDAAVTKITEKDMTGAIFSATENFSVPIEIATAGPTPENGIRIYVALSGATAPSLTAILFDNR